MDDLLKEAIADAKQVRETALANAKMALEEAFTPRLQSMLSKKIQAEVEDEEVPAEFSDEDEDEVAPEAPAEFSAEDDEVAAEVPAEFSDEDDDVSTSDWINTPNAWQIGALAYTYWAKIHPSEAPLGMTYHVGYAISNRFKWVPKNIHESLVETLKKPCSIIWTTQDDQNAEKIDLDGSLGRKKAELNASLLESYEKELLELGANVRCTLSTNKFDGKLDEVRWDHETYFMPLEKFLEVKDEYSLESLYSRLWPLDAFYNGGTIDMDALSKYERESVTMLQIFSNVMEAQSLYVYKLYFFILINLNIN